MLRSSKKWITGIANDDDDGAGEPPCAARAALSDGRKIVVGEPNKDGRIDRAEMK